MRLSTLASQLQELDYQLEMSGRGELSDYLKPVKQLPRPGGASSEFIIGALSSTLKNARSELDNLRYDAESNGARHLARSLLALRRQAGLDKARPRKPARTAGPRYANARLGDFNHAGVYEPLPPKEARLIARNTVHLSVQIGPQDDWSPAFEAVPILEEVFQWKGRQRGAWLEVGLTGLDFEVLGDPLQRLWLPRRGASDPVHFALQPRKAPVSRLRFCLYYRNNLVQSYRLAALVFDPEHPALKPEGTGVIELAQALGLWPKESGEVVADINARTVVMDRLAGLGYAVRLEYSLGASAESITNLPQRAVSIVANDNDGQPVVTVKGKRGGYSVRSPGDLPDYVKEARQMLDRISTPPRLNLPRKDWGYGFATSGVINAGDDPTFKKALMGLAESGWRIYKAIIPQSQRPALRQALETDGETIHVAHILLEKVIPWALVYEQEYDADMKRDPQSGAPLAHTACLAPLPGPDGKLGARRCGEHPDCCLHPDRLKERQDAGLDGLRPETVACPRHFWGFRHILEVPPQQVGSSGQASEQQVCVLAGKPAQMLAGFNGTLKLGDAHWQELEKLAGANAAWKPRLFDRDAIKGALLDRALDLIYFYCHAVAEKSSGIFPQYLEFQAPGLGPGRLKADGFPETTWEHHPLVFLNACGSLGYSPSALSPFITTLVDDNQAAGVIGTEIIVWEYLATEMARLFLERFLGGESAGEALLYARRALLAKKNPLGLAYTLYSSGDLKLCVK